MKQSDLAVYFIMGTENCKEEPLKVLEEALKAGITFFQYREKGQNALKGEAYEEFAKKCHDLCKEYKVPFIVNDDVELAIKLDADGIHIGQDDRGLEEIREQFVGKIIGVSVHTHEEIKAAVLGGADYVGIGPIYETKSKLDAKAPAGVNFLQSVRANYPKFPIVAIGGISTENAHLVFQAGADGVAVISTICESVNRVATVKKLKER